jgi:tetratricopeptide (TPR) repeat protein
MQTAGGPPVVSTIYSGGFRITAAVQKSAASQGSSVAALLQSRRPSVTLPLLITARQFAARHTPHDSVMALQAATEATMIDPEYGAAWVALAELHVQQALRYFAPAMDSARLARKAADQALSRDPQCGPAMAVRGWVRALIGREVALGLSDLEAAVDMDCDYAPSWLLQAALLQSVGKHLAAVEAAQMAQQCNAHCVSALAAVPWCLLQAGQLQAAQDNAQAALARTPHLAELQFVMSLIYSSQECHFEALNHAQRARELSPYCVATQAQLAYALVRSGQAGEAKALLSRMTAPGALNPSACLAPVYLALGDADAAVCGLQLAKAEFQPQLWAMRFDQRLRSLRNTRAFGALWN